MAFSFVENHGTNKEQTSNTSLSIAPASTIPVGAVLVLFAACDNIAVSTGDTTTHSVTDSQSNTWTRVSEKTFSDAGVALDGVTVSTHRCVVTTQLTTGDSITLTISSATTAKIIGLTEFSVAAGSTLETTTTTGATKNELASGGTDLSAAFSGLTSAEYLIVSSASIESVTRTLTLSEDADYTNLADLVSQSASSGAIWGSFRYRIATLTGDTVLPTWTWASGTCDAAHTVGVIHEVVSAGGNKAGGLVNVAQLKSLVNGGLVN
ncbi:MAG: hypothetical protein IT393_07245 [Nitrospirae bacterium]|nr:hypothetical protein [Nitrospirota bacterium]